MAGLLIEARAAARLAGQSALEPAVLEDLLTRYRALTGAGLTANLYRRAATAKDARCLARRFRIVESYLSTAAKWGITKLDALRDLFNGHAWKPPGLEPAG
jgi:hypothetical protein